MTVFEMYVENGNRAGFWLFRDSWGRTIARVVEIAGQTEGPLPRGLGRHPHYDKARDLVYCEIWRIVEAVPVRLERDMDPLSSVPGRDALSVLSCPGTHAYQWVVGVPDVDSAAA